MLILGEYTTSICKALNEINPNWKNYDGLIVAGSHTIKGPEAEKIIAKIKEYREAGKPIYGECFGHQVCAIEYARNVLGIKDATSEEFGQFGQGTFVVKKRPELKVGLHDGESFWNNYEVDLPQWNKPKNMFTAQSHPSYQSSPWSPAQLLVNFLFLCKHNADTQNL